MQQPNPAFAKQIRPPAGVGLTIRESEQAITRALVPEQARHRPVYAGGGGNMVLSFD